MPGQFPTDDHFAALSALLRALRVHGSVEEVELLSECRRYGFRAGALPWTAVLREAKVFRFVETVSSGLTLTSVGLVLANCVGADLEPNDEFTRALTAFSVARGSSRGVLTQARL